MNSSAIATAATHPEYVLPSAGTWHGSDFSWSTQHVPVCQEVSILSSGEQEPHQTKEHENPQ
jgi:hypothetical protein